LAVSLLNPTFALLKIETQWLIIAQQKKTYAIRDLKATKGKEMSDKFPGVASMIDKLAKKGVIHKNKAANLKSKLAKKTNASK